MTAAEAKKFNAIIAAVASGVATYKAIDMNGANRRAFYGLLAKDADAREQYARAKADCLECMADEIIEIADESRRGVKTTTKADGTTETVEGDMVERTRLQIDSRKWLLSKLAPKKYGDKVDVQHAGTVDLSLTVKGIG